MPVQTLHITNKIVVITGGGSGIGLSFTKLAIQNGARVLIADLRLTPEAADYVEKKKASGKVAFVKCDVSKRADLENLAPASQRAFNDTPDVWVASAGVFEPKWSNFWDDTEDNDYKQLAINATHPMKLTRIAIKSLLKANKKGVMLIVASLAGYQGAFGAPLYCASKHAVVGFVRSMGELDKYENIKVVLSAPGNVTTPLWTSEPAKMKQFGTTAENSISPEKVAESMLQLVEKAEYPGGTCLEISSAGSRVLGIWDIAAPEAAGTAPSEAALTTGYKPILDLMRVERGGGAKL